MNERIKIFLASFASQMFVVYVLKLIENPWVQILVALFINIVALLIYVIRLRRLKK